VPITYSENIVVILVALIFLESAIIFGIWINNRSNHPENRGRFLHGFQFSDKLQLVIFLVLMALVLIYIFLYVYPLIQSVQDAIIVSGVKENLPYMSISTAFLALGFSMFSLAWTFIINIFSAVNHRNNFQELNNRLVTIERTLQRIENNN
jgi:hypothetical protein